MFEPWIVLKKCYISAFKQIMPSIPFDIKLTKEEDCFANLDDEDLDEAEVTLLAWPGYLALGLVLLSVDQRKLELQEVLEKIKCVEEDPKKLSNIANDFVDWLVFLTSPYFVNNERVGGFRFICDCLNLFVLTCLLYKNFMSEEEYLLEPSESMFKLCIDYSKTYGEKQISFFMISHLMYRCMSFLLEQVKIPDELDKADSSSSAIPGSEYFLFSIEDSDPEFPLGIIYHPEKKGNNRLVSAARCILEGEVDGTFRLWAFSIPSEKDYYFLLDHGFGSKNNFLRAMSLCMRELSQSIFEDFIAIIKEWNKFRNMPEREAITNKVFFADWAKWVVEKKTGSYLLAEMDELYPKMAQMHNTFKALDESIINLSKKISKIGGKHISREMKNILVKANVEINDIIKNVKGLDHNDCIANAIKYQSIKDFKFIKKDDIKYFRHMGYELTKPTLG